MTAPVPGAGQGGGCLSTVGYHHLDGDACRCGLLVRRPTAAGQDVDQLVTAEAIYRVRFAADAHHVQDETIRRIIAAVAPDIAAAADQRWTTELTAQADRYASVGTEIADAMAEALRTAVRIMHRAPTETGRPEGQLDLRPKCPRCGAGRLVKAELSRPAQYDCGHPDWLADLRRATAAGMDRLEAEEEQG